MEPVDSLSNGYRSLRALMVPTLAALQFLTIVPPVVRRPFTPLELGQAVGHFPLVGVLLGGVLAGLDSGLKLIFPPGVTAALVLAGWVILTGALHLDGFLDTCDGLFGGRDPAARLRILRDERVGAFAVAGGVLLLLTKHAALSSRLDSTAALLLAPTLGRCGMAAAIVAFPYARAEGLGRTMKDNAGGRQASLATGIALVTALFIANWLGLVAMALSGAVTWAVARFATGRLPGLTGDIYGAVCELVETAVLLAFVAGGAHP